MQPTTIRFCQQYRAMLEKTTCAAEVHGALANWLFRNEPRVSGLTADLNQSLGLQGDFEFKANIPTAAVGSLKGLLVVSANPGWSRGRNALEHAYRMRSARHNREFCARFFDVFQRQVGTAAWWTRALALAHFVENGVPSVAAPGIPVPPRPRERWRWAADSKPDFGNVDLLPFHSTADGFGLMTGLSPANAELRRLALSTLRMVLRLRPAPRLTLVASAAGAGLVQDSRDSLGLVALPELADLAAKFDAIRLYRHEESGARLMTFPYQVFAGNVSMSLPRGYLVELARHIRACADPPY